MKYCQIEFKAGGKRFTYENAGAAIGDEVMVATKNGDKRVKVVGLTDDPPTEFAAKPIKGLAPKKDAARNG